MTSEEMKRIVARVNDVFAGLDEMSDQADLNLLQAMLDKGVDWDKLRGALSQLMRVNARIGSRKWNPAVETFRNFMSSGRVHIWLSKESFSPEQVDRWVKSL